MLKAFVIVVWFGVAPVVYGRGEGWSRLDAFYFAAVTVSTVG